MAASKRIAKVSSPSSPTLLEALEALYLTFSTTSRSTPNSLPLPSTILPSPPSIMTCSTGPSLLPVPRGHRTLLVPPSTQFASHHKLWIPIYRLYVSTSNFRFPELTKFLGKNTGRNFQPPPRPSNRIPLQTSHAKLQDQNLPPQCQQ